MCAAAEAGSSGAPQQPDSSLPPQQGAFRDHLPEAPGVTPCTVSNSNTAAVSGVSPDARREDVVGSDQAETNSPPDTTVRIICMLTSHAPASVMKVFYLATVLW